MRRLLVALSALVAGVLLVPDDASALRGGGVRGGGASRSFHAGGFRGAAVGRYRGGAVGVRRGAVGYRAAVVRPGVGRYGRAYGAYRGTYRRGYPYYGYYRRGYPYRYGYYRRAYPYRYGYYGAPYGVAYGGDCYWIRRRVVGPYGRIVIRRVRVCGY